MKARSDTATWHSQIVARRHGGGSHHITEEGLWLGQKALREGEKHHIAREGLVSHVYGGHARLFSPLDFIWTLRKGSINESISYLTYQVESHVLSVR